MTYSKSGWKPNNELTLAGRERERRAWVVLSFAINAITKKNKFFPGLGRKLRVYYICIINTNKVL